MSSVTEARATAAEGLAVEDRRLQVAGIPTAVARASVTELISHLLGLRV